MSASLAFLMLGCGSGPAISASATVSPAPDATKAAAREIVELTAEMQAAVLAGDDEAYLRLVDTSDPVFSLEHHRWAADWSAKPPTGYSLSVENVVVRGQEAAALFTVRWSMDDQPERTASFPVSFTHFSTGWLYAGETWQSTQAEHFRVDVLPGLEQEVPAVLDALPAIYDQVTTSLGFEPDASMQIKIYPDAPALVANTLLSLPDIHGWNEPGESLKLRVDHSIPSLAPAITHEFTHFAIFDRAGTARSRMPWWLDEGIAVFIAAGEESPEQSSNRLNIVAQWVADDQLPDWSAASVFETTPQDLWRYVYPMGYAMVRYITETDGTAKRNEWLAAMATASTIEDATPAVLGRSFDNLAAGFRKWVVAQ